MPRSERDETLGVLTNRIFSAMLEELIMDATLQSHQEVARARTECPICHTKCSVVHTPGSLASAIESGAITSSSSAVKADTPSSSVSEKPASQVNGSGGGAGTSTPTSTKDGNLYLECVVCARQISSNRYAPHLANCMGLSSTRRAPARMNAKAKQPSDAGRSASPMSESGNFSDDKGSKGKGKAGKAKKADESEFSLKRKRPGSPQVSPQKKAKKGKVNASPVSRVKADSSGSGLPTNSHYSPTTNSQSKVPSKLRESSTTSFLERSSSSSRESSPTAPTPTSSFSSTSPVRPLMNKPPRGRPPAVGTGPPKRPSPAQAQARPPPVHMPYMEIDEGEETGSSTETEDSS